MVSAARSPIGPHPATCRDAANAPEKRKVGGSTPPLTTSEQRKRWLDHLCRPGLLTLANRGPDGLGEDKQGSAPGRGRRRRGGKNFPHPRWYFLRSLGRPEQGEVVVTRDEGPAELLDELRPATAYEDDSVRA
jgi:hypothetical protein